MHGGFPSFTALVRRRSAGRAEWKGCCYKHSPCQREPFREAAHIFWPVAWGSSV